MPSPGSSSSGVTRATRTRSGAPGRGVTLSDVANRAGVSLATASRALNGGSRTVAAELRDRVLAAATELRYVSHGPAQALARSTTSIVGMIVHDVRDPYFSSIAAGAMRVAREEGLMVMLASTFRDQDLELDYVERLRAQRARGIVLVGSSSTRRAFSERLAALVEAYEAEGGRAACITKQNVASDAVLIDNSGGGADVARLLLDLGHRRIGIVTGPRQLITVRHRLTGAAKVMAAAGVELSDDAIVEGDFSREGGEAATTRLIEQRPDLTAVFALNDLMARGALLALSKTGRVVPDDVSVVGFDDLPVASDTAPRLTTIRLPLEEIGERAMHLVLRDRDQPRHLDRVSGELVVRESTGPPAASGVVGGRTRRSIDRPTKDRPSKDRPTKDQPTRDRPTKDRRTGGSARTTR